MIPTWEQMHAAILQQMDESEKTTGVRRTTNGTVSNHFGWSGGQNTTYYTRQKYRNEFVAAGFVYVSRGCRSGIYMKEDVEKNLHVSQHITKSKPKNDMSPHNVLSLIDRLDAPVEKKSVETLLAEQIRLQLDRNAQFADRIFQIAMGA